MRKKLVQDVVVMQKKINDVKSIMKTGFFSYIAGQITGDYARYKSMRQTINEITNPEKFQLLQQHALDNLSMWQEEKVDSPLEVDVLDIDWGVAALKATAMYGQAYAVLNMANSKFPGGLVFEGGSAQEENIWHRSTCVLTLLDQGVHFDRANDAYYYDDETRRLVRGQAEFSPKELALLNSLRQEQLAVANKVYLNHCPQICFRGSELLAEHGFDYGKNSFFAEPSLSFQKLSDNKIFPFYELRSAAPNLSGRNIDWKNSVFLENYTKRVRRKIAAQLDTLILAGIPNVILGAWGCGSFKNNPEIIAEIYREEIEKRSECFQHIVFSILTTRGYSDSYGPFNKHLQGLKLDYSPEKIKNITTEESVRENFTLSPMRAFEGLIADKSEVKAKRRD